MQAEMELTLQRYGITVKVLRARAEESTPRIVRRRYERHNSEQIRDHRQECLKASASRFVSPIR